MTLAEVRQMLDADIIAGERLLDRTVQHAFGADLMSDVLALAREGCLLITGLTNMQSLRTAYALDIAAILICRGKIPSAEYGSTAEELNIPVLATKHILFESCGRLYAHGMLPSVREVVHDRNDAPRTSDTFGGSYSIHGGEFESAGDAASKLKKTLRTRGMPEHSIRKAAVVVFEAEVNIISYAYHGTITYRVTPEMISIDADDSGPGIPDIDLALQEGYSTADARIREMGFGAGMGLSNIRKFSDAFEITSDIGLGTHVHSSIRMPSTEHADHEAG